MVRRQVEKCPPMDKEVAIVQNSRLDYDKSLTLKQAFAGYQYAKHTFWVDASDNRYRKLAVVYLQPDLTRYLGHVDKFSGWRVSQKAIDRMTEMNRNKNIIPVLAMAFSVNPDKTVQIRNACYADLQKSTGRIDGKVLPADPDEVIQLVYGNEADPIMLLSLWASENEP